MDRNLARGLFLAAVSLAFGLGSLQYSMGSFSKAGPGLFPFMVSVLLFLIALATIVRSRFVRPEPMEIKARNIALLLGALCAFALVSKFVNMSAGIAVMVFVAALAGSSYSWVRNLKIAAGLLAVAFAFRYFLGQNLPLL